MLWLEKGGADLSKVKLFELPLGEMGPALARGTVAAALMGEPFITDNKDTVKHLSVPFDSVARASTSAAGTRNAIGSRRTRIRRNGLHRRSTRPAAGRTRTARIRR